MWIYNLVIRCYALLIHLSAFSNPKAKQWVEGRKNWRKNLKNQLSPLGTAERVWMHCASYGEFEQGRPLLEAIRKQKPHLKIVLSFFSPSGYDAFKNWPGADAVVYLPFDSATNAKEFVNLVQAKWIIFIKYEFWLNFLNELKHRGAQVFLVSAVFKPHHPFFRWYGGIFKDSLSAFKTIFVQDTASLKLLEKAGIHHALVSGDTRFDRVLQIQNSFEPIPFFEQYCQNHKIIVAGSTWPRDEDFLLQAFMTLNFQNLKLILVPHEVDKRSIEETEQRLKALGLKYNLFSEVKDKVDVKVEKVLVLDTIGLLSRLYHYADVAYVGGGFDTGIHNLLEPAVHLKPILFCGQTDYKKYNEALELIEIDGARAVSGSEELEEVLKHFLSGALDKSHLEKRIQTYFTTRAGATQKVMDVVFRSDRTT